MSNNSYSGPTGNAPGPGLENKSANRQETKPSVSTSQFYCQRILTVMQFIDDHLDQDLSVDRLAEVALISKFHFHRIFKGTIGETLNAYVVRRRLERAAKLIKYNSELSVTDVCFQVGFNSPEHFSRCFKEKFGVTANAYRNSDPADPDSLKNSKIYQELAEGSFYHIHLESRSMPRNDFKVQVRSLPEYNVAFVSDVFGDDGMNLVNAYLHLMEWANEHGFFNKDSIRLAVSRDDIEITPADQYRMEYCISVPEGTKGTGRVGVRSTHGGLYALIHVQGDIHLVAQAWDFMYKHWLPTSDYIPVDQPAIENFLKGPEEIGWETFDLEVGIPVKRHRT